MQAADQLPDKALARRSFEHAAAGYDEVAVLQQEVAQRLLQRLDLMKLQPCRVLDLGCGTAAAGGCANPAVFARMPSACRSPMPVSIWCSPT